jgi:hypothetical protein
MRPRKTTFEERAAALKGRLNSDQETIAGIEEKPLTVKQAAERWGQSPRATRRYFMGIIGVRIKPSPERHQGGRKKRRYVTLLIPPSVLEREIRKYTKMAA